MLEDTDGLPPPLLPPLDAVAGWYLLLLTHAILMTSSRWKVVHGGVAFAVDPNAGHGYVDVVPNPAAGGKTIATLMAELEGSYDDIGTITAFCDDDTTDAELRSMTPAQFGAVVTAVAFSLDQPKAASMLARGIGPNLRCGHVGENAHTGLYRHPSEDELEDTDGLAALTGTPCGWEQTPQ